MHTGRCEGRWTRTLRDNMYKNDPAGMRRRSVIYNMAYKSSFIYCKTGAPPERSLQVFYTIRRRKSSVESQRGHLWCPFILKSGF